MTEDTEQFNEAISSGDWSKIVSWKTLLDVNRDFLEKCWHGDKVQHLSPWYSGMEHFPRLESDEFRRFVALQRHGLFMMNYVWPRNESADFFDGLEFRKLRTIPFAQFLYQDKQGTGTQGTFLNALLGDNQLSVRLVDEKGNCHANVTTSEDGILQYGIECGGNSPGELVEWQGVDDYQWNRTCSLKRCGMGMIPAIRKYPVYIVALSLRMSEGKFRCPKDEDFMRAASQMSLLQKIDSHAIASEITASTSLNHVYNHVYNGYKPRQMPIYSPHVSYLVRADEVHGKFVSPLTDSLRSRIRESLNLYPTFNRQLGGTIQGHSDTLLWQSAGQVGTNIVELAHCVKTADNARQSRNRIRSGNAPSNISSPWYNFSTFRDMECTDPTSITDIRQWPAGRVSIGCNWV